MYLVLPKLYFTGYRHLLTYIGIMEIQVSSPANGRHGFWPHVMSNSSFLCTSVCSTRCYFVCSQHAQYCLSETNTSYTLEVVLRPVCTEMSILRIVPAWRCLMVAGQHGWVEALFQSCNSGGAECSRKFSNAPTPGSTVSMSCVLCHAKIHPSFDPGWAKQCFAGLRGLPPWKQNLMMVGQ